MSCLEQVEVVAERNSQAPLKVGMAKLKGTHLCDVHKICDLPWPQLRKLLIENYSDIPYVSDTMVASNSISQAEDKSVSQYLIHAKDYLECINHTSRLSSMDGSGLNHISLVQGLSDTYVRRRASKDAENWKTMADGFDSIAKIVRTAGEQKHMNPGMRNPLISMLYATTIITVKEVLLTGTEAPIKITKLAITAVGTIARTICPDKVATKNQCVTTMQVPITSPTAHSIKKIRTGINTLHNR